MSFTQADYQAVLREFEALADEKYKKFNESLIPGTETAYGVRTPAVRAIAKRILRQDAPGFLAVSRPGSYEETMLRGIVMAGMKLDLEQKLPLVEGFLPLIDNWAVCDSFCGSFSLKKPEERERMWQFLRPLFSEEREFTARFAAVMLLGHYVTEDYVDEGLSLLESMKQEAYYIQMAVAWAVSVCYVKFPQRTLPLLRRQTLPKFTQNKSIQKIRESYRVPREDKDMLLAYKV